MVVDMLWCTKSLGCVMPCVRRYLLALLHILSSCVILIMWINVSPVYQEVMAGRVIPSITQLELSNRLIYYKLRNDMFRPITGRHQVSS